MTVSCPGCIDGITSEGADCEQCDGTGQLDEFEKKVTRRPEPLRPSSEGVPFMYPLEWWHFPTLLFALFLAYTVWCLLRA